MCIVVEVFPALRRGYQRCIFHKRTDRFMSHRAHDASQILIIMRISSIGLNQSLTVLMWTTKLNERMAE